MGIRGEEGNEEGAEKNQKELSDITEYGQFPLDSIKQSFSVKTY